MHDSSTYNAFSSVVQPSRSNIKISKITPKLYCIVCHQHPFYSKELPFYLIWIQKNFMFGFFCLGINGLWKCSKQWGWKQRRGEYISFIGIYKWYFFHCVFHLTHITKNTHKFCKLLLHTLTSSSQGSSVIIVTILWAGWSRQEQDIFCFCRLSVLLLSGYQVSFTGGKVVRAWPHAVLNGRIRGAVPLHAPHVCLHGMDTDSVTVVCFVYFCLIL